MSINGRVAINHTRHRPNTAQKKNLFSFLFATICGNIWKAAVSYYSQQARLFLDSLQILSLMPILWLCDRRALYLFPRREHLNLLLIGYSTQGDATTFSKRDHVAAYLLSVVVEHDKENDEVDSVPTIACRRPLKSDVKGEPASETVVQKFVVRPKRRVLCTAMLEDGEQSSRPSVVCFEW